MAEAVENDDDVVELLRLIFVRDERDVPLRIYDSDLMRLEQVEEAPDKPFPGVGLVVSGYVPDDDNVLEMSLQDV